jgi:hypothetical protein
LEFHVIPAKAGIHVDVGPLGCVSWVPAFAGMTEPSLIWSPARKRDAQQK